MSDAEWSMVVRQHFAKRRRQRTWGTALVVGGVLIIVNHFLEHAGTLRLLNSLVSPRTQDVVAGFPLGVILLLGALLLFGQVDDPPSRSSQRGRSR